MSDQLTSDSVPAYPQTIVDWRLILGKIIFLLDRRFLQIKGITASNQDRTTPAVFTALYSPTREFEGRANIKIYSPLGASPAMLVQLDDQFPFMYLARELILLGPSLLVFDSQKALAEAHANLTLANINEIISSNQIIS